MNQKNIIFITGATAGIGEATAMIFAKSGWDLIITERRKERLDSLSAKIEATYKVKVLPLTFECTRPFSSKRCHSKYTEKLAFY